MDYRGRRFQRRRFSTGVYGGSTMKVKSTKVKTSFQQRNVSEQIMIIKGFDEFINVKIGDTVKIGPGIYMVMEYNPKKVWHKN